MLSERRAVVDLGSVLRNHGHGTLGHQERGESGAHVAELVGNVLSIGVLNGIRINLGNGASHVRNGTLGRCLACKPSGQTVGISALAHKRGAVVGLLAALRHDYDRRLALRHFELAQLLLDRVVALLGITGPLDCVSVGAFADLGLGTDHSKGRSLAIDEAFDFAVGREGRAVVRLARAHRNHGELLGLNHQFARLLGNLQAVRNILAFGVHDNDLINISDQAVGTSHVGSLGARPGRLHGITLGNAGHGNLGAMRHAVVGHGHIIGNSHDFVCIFSHG